MAKTGFLRQHYLVNHYTRFRFFAFAFVFLGLLVMDTESGIALANY